MDYDCLLDKGIIKSEDRPIMSELNCHDDVVTRRTINEQWRGEDWLNIERA